MTAAIATTLRKTLVSAAIAAATMVAGTGAANATVYEYSFSGLVQSATTIDALGNTSSGAYGRQGGSPITGRLLIDSVAFQFSENGTSAGYFVGEFGLTIDGLNLSGLPTNPTYTVVNNTASTQRDSLTFFARSDVASNILGYGTLDTTWSIAAPTSWLSSTAMPTSLPISDFLPQHSFGTLSTSGIAGYGSQSLYFSIDTISPVPEPSTYALMLAGLALVGGVAARRRSAQGNGSALA